MVVVGVECEKPHARTIKVALERSHLLDKSLSPISTPTAIVFPTHANDAAHAHQALALELGANAGAQFRVVEREFGEGKGKGKASVGLKEWLVGRLEPHELNQVRAAFNVIGDCAVVEVPPPIAHHAPLIAQGVLATHRNVRCVCKVEGAHEGAFRVQPLSVIGGNADKPLRATYRESNCEFRISLDKVFFSPRLSFERSRICGLVAAGERVGAFFAGVGPFPIILAKSTNLHSAVAVELNPHAVDDMRHNVKANGVEDRVEVVEGDVREVCAAMGRVFHRIIMPIPHELEGDPLFLQECCGTLVVPGGVCHFYDVVPDSEPLAAASARIAHALCNDNDGVRYEVAVRQQRQVRRFSPGTVQVVTDFELTSMAVGNDQ